MKQCPFCAEDIQDAAIVCKHCGRDLRVGASQVQSVASKQKTSLVTWGCLTVLVIVGITMFGAMFCATMTSPSRSRPSTADSTPAPAASEPSPQVTSEVTADDLKREKHGKFGSRKVSALEKDGTWVVRFEPALPREDRAAFDGAEYALREMLGVNTNNASWRQVDKFMRIITGDGIFDVLFLKAENGTVHGMAIVKR